MPFSRMVLSSLTPFYSDQDKKWSDASYLVLQCLSPGQCGDPVPSAVQHHLGEVTHFPRHGRVVRDHAPGGRGVQVEAVHLWLFQRRERAEGKLSVGRGKEGVGDRGRGRGEGNEKFQPPGRLDAVHVFHTLQVVMRVEESENPSNRKYQNVVTK
jgi:hypothetical protein